MTTGTGAMTSSAFLLITALLYAAFAVLVLGHARRPVVVLAVGYLVFMAVNLTLLPSLPS